MRFFPPSLIRKFGQLQFKFPILRRPINFLAKKLSASPGRIWYGTGRGLMINAKGCNPGFLFGTSEPLEQELVKSLLCDGDVFYDIGANAGFYCLLGARFVGNSGTVYGFEPTPKLADRIRENAKLNLFENIVVVESAVGAIDGSVEFCIDGELSVQNSIALSSSVGKTLTVPCTTIDSYAMTHKLPTLLLIDVEGAEIDVLRGGLKTIRNCKPAIMVEVHWLGKAFVDFYETELQTLGYVCTTYDGLPIPTGNDRYHCLLRVL